LKHALPATIPPPSVSVWKDRFHPFSRMSSAARSR
jgi:hypothetical protein